MYLFCGRLRLGDDERLVKVMENAILGGAAFPHEHQKVTVRANRRNRSMPKVASVVDALTPMPDEGLGKGKVRQSFLVLWRNDDQEALGRKSNECLGRQRMPFKGREPHRKRPTLCPVDSKHGLAVGSCVVEVGVGVEAQRPPIIDQAAAARIEEKHLAEGAEG